MKPPKNFYSNLDRRKQGLPELPEASAADAGKIIKVGEDGAYELGTDERLPDPSTINNGALLQMQGNNWVIIKPIARTFLSFASNSNGTFSANPGIRIIKTNNSFTMNIFASPITYDTLVNNIDNQCYPVMVDNLGTKYYGVIYSANATNISIIACNSKKLYTILIGNDNSITVSPYGGTKYYEITSSGSSVSLPSGVTFADVYAELQAGVDVKFTSGARVYSVTSFESTNIRAHWMSDLDLTSMEVYVINLASDGTGTVASATFSGS